RGPISLADRRQDGHRRHHQVAPRQSRFRTRLAPQLGQGEAAGLSRKEDPMDAFAPPKPKVLFEAEPFIPYMREEAFDPRLKPVVEPYKKRMGFLPNALKLYAHRPEIA